MMQYGKIIRTTIVMDGEEAQEPIRYEQSIRVNCDGDVKAIYDSLMDQYGRREIINPGIQVEVYPDTGKIKRVVKCWSEVL